MDDNDNKKSVGLVRSATNVLLFWFGLIGLAVGVAANFEPIIHVSSWVAYALSEWDSVLESVYDSIGRFFGVHVHRIFYDMALMGIFLASIYLRAASLGAPEKITPVDAARSRAFLARRFAVSAGTIVTMNYFVGNGSPLIWVATILVVPILIPAYLRASRGRRFLFSPDKALLKILVYIWIGVLVLVLFSQTRLIELLAGPPPAS